MSGPTYSNCIPLNRIPKKSPITNNKSQIANTPNRIRAKNIQSIRPGSLKKITVSIRMLKDTNFPAYAKLTYS